MSDRKTIRLKPATIERLRAACSAMGISPDDAGVDQLVERIIIDSLPTIEHEDLLEAPAARGFQ
jgi:hypothetical protein